MDLKHDRIKYVCKECGGGSICEHNKLRPRCRDCDGGAFCDHDKRRDNCHICSPHTHLKGIVRARVRNALNNNKNKKSIEYLGCTIEEFRNHITSKFIEGMSWNNYGEWEIDHIVPIMYKNPSLDDVIKRLHWKNTQPMWKFDNQSKGNRLLTLNDGTTIKYLKLNIVSEADLKLNMETQNKVLIN